MTRLVVVSNRVVAQRQGDAGSVGGLAVAVLDALKEGGGVWFGWSGRHISDEPVESHVSTSGNITYATLDLSERDYAEYYTGYANSVLWPLFHYRLDLTDFSRRDMAGYHRVNALFARKLLPLLRKDDVVWIHDYHFIPFGAHLREAGCRQKIGFFLHIPWPSPEVLLALPNHARLARALCTYDLIGFQTESDRSAFTEYIEREAGGELLSDGVVKAFGRTTLTGVFPISVDTRAVRRMAARAAASPQTKRLIDSLGGRDLVIGVDRLDYTKGLVERLEAYEVLLRDYPENRGRVVLLQITPPSRTEVPEYQEIRQEIESAAGHINGNFAEFDWNPVRYLNRSYKRSTLMGFLRRSTVGLVTPLRDGMNLVAKEYVAAQSPSNPGVLVLSRFAGAARELDAALIVNPYNIEGVAEAMQKALTMSLDERKRRWRSMYDRLKRFDIAAWRRVFLDALEASPARD